MSVTTVCPACGVAATLSAPPVTWCPSCGVAFPPTLRAALEAELRHAKVPKPVLLQIGTIGSLFMAATCLVSLALTLSNIGSFEIDGEAVTGPEFLRQAGPFMVFVGTLSGAVAYGLLTDRAWSRPAMILFWCGTLALMIGYSIRDRSANAGCAVVQSVVALALAAWYLYRKESVVAYYSALEMRNPPSPPE